MNVFAVSDSNQRSPLLGDAGAVSETLTVAPAAIAALTQAVPFHWSTCPLAADVIVTSLMSSIELILVPALSAAFTHSVPLYLRT